MGNYWKYPKDSTILIDKNEFIDKFPTFPEDIYIFDETLSWTVVLTHEVTDMVKRSCLVLQQ